MRLIDADAELKKLDEMEIEGATFVTAVSFAKLVLLNAPTADVEPVRHGRWIKRTGGALGYDCTVCGKSEVSNHFDFCPNCGARMDGEQNG